jgi:hypothetical protein
LNSAAIAALGLSIEQELSPQQSLRAGYSKTRGTSTRVLYTNQF